jgi:hypothetical protein
MGDLCGKAAAREHASGMEASEPASPEWVDEVRELLDEAYRFQSTSPKAQENINAALELIDQHASGVQGTFHDQPKSPE